MNFISFILAAELMGLRGFQKSKDSNQYAGLYYTGSQFCRYGPSWISQKEEIVDAIVTSRKDISCPICIESNISEYLPT